MGFAKVMKEALLRPFRSTNVQHFNAGTTTTAAATSGGGVAAAGGSTRRHVGRDHRGVSSGKVEPQPSTKTVPGPSRSAWKRRSKRKTTTFLTPVPEEKEEQLATDETTTTTTNQQSHHRHQLVQRHRSEAAYIESASGLGLGVSGSASQVKKTHILIDLRELTKAINESDGDMDSSDDQTPTSGTICYAPALPPSQYVKRHSFRLGRSAAHKRIGFGSVRTKQHHHQQHHHQQQAAPQPTGAQTGQTRANYGKQLAPQISAMAMLDNIIRTEQKLDVPYLTKENVDTSLPGSTAVSQKAGAPGPAAVQPKEASTSDNVSSSSSSEDDDETESIRSENDRPDAKSNAQAGGQMQRSKSFGGHDSATQSPMKMFRKHNVTDITSLDVPSADLVVCAAGGAASDIGVCLTHANHSSNHSHYDDGTSRQSDQLGPEPEPVPGRCDGPESEGKAGGPKQVEGERAEVKKEVKFVTDKSALEEQARPTRMPSAGNLTRPILSHGGNANNRKEQDDHDGDSHNEPEKEAGDQKPEPRKANLTRSMSARTYRSMDNSQRLLMNDVIPKTSFFSCHEKTLTEAGYNVKELEKAARLVKIKRTCSRKSSSKESQSPASSGDRPRAACKEHSELKRSRSFMSLTKSFRRKQKSRHSDDGDKSGTSEVKVDPAPLLRYLQIVLDRPAEYAYVRDCAASFAASGLHQSVDSLRSGATNDAVEAQHRTDSLIELSRAFRKCQENFGPPESLLLQALNELGNKTWDSHPICAKYESYRKAKHQFNKTKRHPLIHSRDNVTQLFNGSTPVDHPDLAKPDIQLTELERARGDVEMWLKTLSMAQVIKAKEMALRAFGEEEKSFSHWWNTNKHCRYIRQATTTGAM